jgi:VWFA-related protein
MIALSSFSVVAIQDPPKAPAAVPLVIQVGVDLIQIDTTVTDNKGRPVTDLTARDFILEVDGKKQPLTNAAYFGSPARMAGATEDATPTREAGAGNTVVFIIDDLNMSFGSMYYARRGLTRFASEWGDSGTRAAIRTTSERADSFTLFTSAEPFEAKAAELRYNLQGNQGVRSPWPMMQERRITNGMSPDAQAAFLANTNPSLVHSNLQQRLFSLVSTINTMRSLPGRKALILVSEGFASIQQGSGPLGFDTPMTALFTGDSDVREALRLITEVANRASVVLYTVDPRGLFVDSTSAEDAEAPSQAVLQSRWFDRTHTQGSLQQLAAATGGLAIINRNDLQGGFSDVLRDQDAYYLIGFEPTAQTFVKSSGRAKFHKIKLSLTRPGLHVRTRAGFYGVTDAEVNELAPTVATSPTTY